MGRHAGFVIKATNPSMLTKFHRAPSQKVRPLHLLGKGSHVRVLTVVVVPVKALYSFGLCNDHLLQAHPLPIFATVPVSNNVPL
jgi:hypothetical protein